jgi:hypothetical protein
MPDYFVIRPEGSTDKAEWRLVDADTLPQVIGSLDADDYEVQALAASPWSAPVTVTEPSDFDPVSLFGSGDAGVIIDAHANEGLFQNADGTSPVTTADQTVRRVGLSGTGLVTFSQSNTANAPVYKTDGVGGYLEANGTDRWMNAPALAAGADEWTWVSWFEPLGADTQNGTIIHAEGANTSQYFQVRASDGTAGGRIGHGFRGGDQEGSAQLFAFVDQAERGTAWASNHLAMSEHWRVSANEWAANFWYFDTLNPTFFASPRNVGTAGIPSGQWSLFRREQSGTGDRYFHGKLRRAVGINRRLTTTERQNLRDWCRAL